MFPCICLVCTHPLPCWGRFHRGLPSLDLASENSSIHLWRCSEALEPGSGHSQTWYSSSSHGYLRVRTQTGEKSSEQSGRDWRKQWGRMAKGESEIEEARKMTLFVFFLAKVKWESPHYSHVCPLNVKLQLEADWCRFISVHMGKHTGQYWYIYDMLIYIECKLIDDPNDSRSRGFFNLIYKKSTYSI